MGNKKKRKKSKAEALRDDVKATAQKVWLAGLGALSVAEEEGSRVFKNLVDKGEDFERRSRPRVEKLREAAGEAADTARRRVEKAADTVADTVGESAGKVGDVIDEKITSALHRFGIPTKSEIDALSASVTALTEKLDGVKRREKATKRKAARRPAAATKKPSAKSRTKKVAKKTTKRTTKRTTKKAAKKPAKKPAKKKPAKKATKRATKASSR